MTDNPVLDADDFDEYIDTELELEPIQIAQDEPILTALLKRAIRKSWADDPVMQDFSAIVLPTLVTQLSSLSAKGGDYTLRAAEKGLSTERSHWDQSFRAHILNGLLATLRIHAEAARQGSDAAFDIGDYGRRLIVAGYLLHDYDKLPEVQKVFLAQFGKDHITPSAQTMTAIYAAVREQGRNFRLPEYFEAGGYAFPADDLVYLIHNTQGTWGTLDPHLLEGALSNSNTIKVARTFTQIADLLAYGTFLEGGTLQKLNNLLVAGLGDPPFKLTAHRIIQVTGIVTSYLHNAAAEALTEAGHTPILFAPNGVIYASPYDAPIPNLDEIAQEAAARVQTAAMRGITNKAGTANAVGIAWGTQGLKTAPFIEALYSPDRVMNLVWMRLRPRLIALQPRKREQLKVYKKLESGIKEGWPWFVADQTAGLAAFMDERAEALADWLAYGSALDARAELNITEIILYYLGFDIGMETELIQTAQKGGVQFWPYLLALRYLRDHSTYSPEQIDAVVQQIIDGALAERFGSVQQPGLGERIVQHARQVILLPSENEQVLSDRFVREMALYSASKVDRKAGAFDTIYNIPFDVEQQQEATLPYNPVPYSQRLPLGSSDALGAWRRGLSGVGVMNMLLMQTALRQPFQFEERKGKMLYLYPVYYFTPETGDALQMLAQRIAYFDLNDWLKHTENGETVNVQKVSTFHTVMQQRPANYAPPIQAMRYAEGLPPTLVQIAVDPGNDAKDASSWVNAVFMALILTIAVDVKIVVSESPMPLYPSGVAFDETLILDAPHAAFADLIGRRVNIDHILPMLHRLTIVAAILRDAYGFDLSQIVRIIRAVDEDSAYAFEGYRRLGDAREKRGYALSDADAHRYLGYVYVLESTHPLGRKSAIMNHARTMVEQYRKFYRAKGFASNAILRPIQAAAETILKSGPANDDPDMLVDAITGRLIQIDNAIMGGDTQGYPPKGSAIAERQVAMREFATYFVQVYFVKGLGQRKANLRGNQFNILRLACDAVYRQKQAEDRAANAQNNDPDYSESENN